MKLSIPIQQLTDRQKAVLFDYAVSAKQISQVDVNRYLAEIERDVMDLGARISRLSAAAPVAVDKSALPAIIQPGSEYGKFTAAARQQRRNARAQKAADTRKRKAAITPEQLASRQLQGRYLALVRQFGKRDRAEWAKIAKLEGRQVAIRRMTNALMVKGKARALKRRTPKLRPVAPATIIAAPAE